MKTNSAIILLGGSASRFGQDINKVYQIINGVPLFIHSVAVFSKLPSFIKIIIVYNKNDYLILENCKKFLNFNNLEFVEGGKTRFESVSNGLKKVESEFVFIHDGARPNLKRKYLEKLIEFQNDHDCLALGLKIHDTVKEITSEGIKTIDRKYLYAVQTPQVFKTEIFKNAINKATSAGEEDLTDDLKVIEKYSFVLPKIIEGDILNFKITTYDDYKLMKEIMEKNKCLE